MMKKLFLYLVIMAAGFASCKKDVQHQPDPIDQTKGSVSGTITPAAAVTGITASNSVQTGISYTVTPGAGGTFKIANMVPGPYKISFTSVSTFMPQPDVNAVLITAGQNTDLGNFSFEAGALIRGIVSPTTSVIYVAANNTQTGRSYLATLDVASGVFKVVVPAGNYSISFSPLYGYKSPGNVTITVITGQVMDLGTVVMMPNMLSGLPFTPQGITQSYSAPNLTISSSYQQEGAVGGRESITITMDNITGPGTYTCKRTATSNITYGITATGGPFGSPARSWSTNNTGGTGTVEVTSIDPVKKEIRGTFTATLVSTTTGAANVVITNGSFYFGY